jgi:hypothetical protein
MVKHNEATPSELETIERIRRRVGLPRAGGLVLGIGDDCAIFRPRGAPEDLLFTTDMLIEDVHFRRETHGAADVGWKALARGLSDIAAMGGEPRFCLLSLALAPWVETRWLDGFYGGLLRLAGRTRTPLMGGDLAHAEKVMCDIVVCGAVPRGKALRRDGARAGDAIYVSGALGGSALGLSIGRRKGVAAASAAPAPPGAGTVSARALAGHRRHGLERRAVARPAPAVAGFRAERGDRGAPAVSRRHTGASAPRRRGLRTAVHGAGAGPRAARFRGPAAHASHRRPGAVELEGVRGYAVELEGRAALLRSAGSRDDRLGI